MTLAARHDDDNELITTRRQVERIAAEVADAHCGLQSQNHAEAHAVFNSLMPELKRFCDEQDAKRQRIEQFKKAWYGAAAVAIVGVIVTALGMLWDAIVTAVQAGHHPR